MTYSTDSERRLDDRDDPRDEAYHAGDQTDTETDTELDAAARPDATDTVDDETARDDMGRDETARDDAMARDGETAGYDETARDDAMAGDNAMARDEREEDETAREEHEEDADYEASHAEYSGTQPTAVAVVPMAAVDESARDEAGAHEAGTDRDAVEAVETESGSVYGTQADDDHRADNGPIVSEEHETATEAPAVQEEMKPGSVESAPVAAFWNDADSQDIRDRWRELQLRFIDDPESVAGEAERLVEEAVASLTAALSRAKQDLGNWRDGQGSDTEKLRAAVRNYRDFLNRVLGL